MAKGKHNVALFEVIHAAKAKQQQQKKSPAALLRTPNWWFRGKSDHLAEQAAETFAAAEQNVFPRPQGLNEPDEDPDDDPVFYRSPPDIGSADSSPTDAGLAGAPQHDIDEAHRGDAYNNAADHNGADHNGADNNGAAEDAVDYIGEAYARVDGADTDEDDHGDYGDSSSDAPEFTGLSSADPVSDGSGAAAGHDPAYDPAYGPADEAQSPMLFNTPRLAGGDADINYDVNPDNAAASGAPADPAAEADPADVTGAIDPTPTSLSPARSPAGAPGVDDSHARPSAIPGSAAPTSATPTSATPDSATPDSATPDSATPDSATPDSATSDSATSDSATRASDAPPPARGPALILPRLRLADDDAQPPATTGQARYSGGATPRGGAPARPHDFDKSAVIKASDATRPDAPVKGRTPSAGRFALNASATASDPVERDAGAATPFDALPAEDAVDPFAFSTRPAKSHGDAGARPERGKRAGQTPAGQAPDRPGSDGRSAGGQSVAGRATGDRSTTPSPAANGRSTEADLIFDDAPRSPDRRAGRAPRIMQVDHDHQAVVLRLSYTAAVITASAAVVAIALALIIGRQWGNPVAAGGTRSTARPAATVDDDRVELSAVSPGVLEVGSGPNMASVNPGPTSPTLAGDGADAPTDNAGPNPTPPGAAPANVGGTLSSDRVVGLQYAVVEGFATDEQAANAAADYLNGAGIAVTVERGLPRWTSNSFTLVGLRPFERTLNSSDWDNYIREIQQVCEKDTGGRLRRVQPMAYKWLGH